MTIVTFRGPAGRLYFAGTVGKSTKIVRRTPDKGPGKPKYTPVIGDGVKVPKSATAVAKPSPGLVAALA